MANFKEKIVLVTGSSRGIGRATILEFASEGANVVINYYSSRGQANELRKIVESLGVKALAVKCDVSKEKDIKTMIQTALDIFGHIDILVNNAGTVTDIPILQRRTNDWIKTFKNNLLSQFLTIKHIAPAMLKNGGGRIINISSTSAIYDFCPEIIDYDVAKAGVITLTKNFAKALAPKILVNAVVPGWVKTEINNTLSKRYINKQKSNIYLRRFADPSEIAKVITFLASEKANFITGSTIIVDGGHD